MRAAHTLNWKIHMFYDKNIAGMETTISNMLFSV